MSGVPTGPRIAIVGPTHPYTGGIAQHTTRLAHELADAGAVPRIESWRAQYPKRLYKGTPRVPRDRPEIPPFDGVEERMSWYSPLSWLAAGRRLRDADAVALTIVTPFHAVPALATSLAAGRRPRRIAIVHNVLPHEPSAVDRVLMRRILGRMDAVIVHSDAQAALARELGVAADRVRVTPLPFPGITGATGARPPLPSAGEPGRVRLLFFGTIRRYKGLDLLLEALADVPGASLLVAGDFWEPVEDYRARITELGLDDRVELRPGYVDTADIPGLFAASDALVMPYRSGTASIVSTMARQSGRPVIVTDVGTLAADVHDGVDGWVVAPEDVPALSAAIREATDPARMASLTGAATDPSEVEARRWRAYAEVLLQSKRDEAVS